MMKIVKMVLLLVMVGLVLGLAPSGETQNKKDYKAFAILIDQSRDMNVNYKEQSKNFIAREVAKRMVNNLAGLKQPLQGAIYEYGIEAIKDKDKIERVMGWKDISQHEGEFVVAVDKCKAQMGPSSLSLVLKELRDDIRSEPVNGYVAVFILSAGNFSDVVSKDKVEKQAKELKDAHPELCIFTVQVGPNDKGQDTLEEIAKKGKCGYYVNADSLGTGLETQNYIQAIFLK
jgi:hypothetical protein